MIIHYLKITFRKLGKNYIFAAINIGGLVIALASSFLIFHFVQSELSTNHFYKNKKNIYRSITWVERNGDNRMSFSGSSYLLANNIKDKFPELIDVARMHSYDFNYGGQYIVKDGESIKAINFMIADESFLNIFSLKILNGNQEKLLPDLNSLLLSESMAKKFFPDENPVGKTLRIENTRETRTFLITGVFKDIPQNSTIRANFIGHIELISDFYTPRGWGISGASTYFLLKEGSDPKAFEVKLNNLIKILNPKITYSHQIQKLTDIYFRSAFLYYNSDPAGNYKLITIYIIIGIVILIVAGINYIIITTASSTERMIEIGMRKVMGAKRLTIIQQILAESCIISFVAMPLAIILSEFALPAFNNLIGKELEIKYFENWNYLIGIFLITFVISLLSGSYISFFVSKFSPEQIFKKRFSIGSAKFNFRKVLIALQIIAFMILFSFSAIIIKQINFMLNKNVGFEYSNLIEIVPAHEHNLYSCKTFTDEIKKNPNIESVTEVNAGISSGVFYNEELTISENPDESIEFNLLQGDFNYSQTLKFNLIEGRFFEEGRNSDTACIILNKTGVLKLGLEDPINQIVLTKSGERFLVIGVVEDFHFNSMHNLINPMGIVLSRYRDMVSQVVVRINPANTTQTIDYLEDSWNKFGPSGKFEYHFYENLIEDNYKDDKDFSKTIRMLTILTILIAAFGIFGFSYYNARQRTKEIGIRKVYGANITDIIKMIYKELGLLIISSGIIAIPAAYLISENWLGNYAYRVDFPYWIFILVFVVSIIIVFLTAGFTAYQTANKNPVDSLKYE